MATSRASNSSILQGFPKSRSLLAGNTAYIPGDFQSISTVTVGAGGSSSITFNSIPSTYSHLQIRALSRSQRSGSAADEIYMTINGNSLTKNHYFFGTGSSILTGSATAGWAGISTAASATANRFGVSVIDIVDYTNANKNKTVRTISGFNNGPGEVYMLSNFINNTSAITSLTFTCSGSNSFAQYSSFALYGVK
jgi:hypothetical protein